MNIKKQRKKKKTEMLYSCKPVTPKINKMEKCVLTEEDLDRSGLPTGSRLIKTDGPFPGFNLLLQQELLIYLLLKKIKINKQIKS